MYLTYRPEGSTEPRRWHIQLGRLRVFDTEAIEKATGMDYGSDFKQRLLQGNVRARRALLWIMLRREHPTLKYADVDFADDELLLEQDRDELAATRAEIAASTELAEANRAALLAVIDQQLATAPEAPGKAPSPSSGDATDSPSPSSTASSPGSSAT